MYGKSATKTIGRMTIITSAKASFPLFLLDELGAAVPELFGADWFARTPLPVPPVPAVWVVLARALTRDVASVRLLVFSSSSSSCTQSAASWSTAAVVV